jgi:hypothetical protein
MQREGVGRFALRHAHAQQSEDGLIQVRLALTVGHAVGLVGKKSAAFLAEVALNRARVGLFAAKKATAADVISGTLTEWAHD